MEYDLRQQPLFEAIGTGLFTFIVILSHANSIADSISLFALLLIFGGVTGGTFNPAVSVGFFIFQGQHLKNLCRFMNVILAQFLGAMVGLVCATIVLGEFVNEKF